ncbi:MAG: D-alanyl-D-alanine carboxypeptidase/D-alanyl-D-alanine endopeptidase [Acidimicrobiales bacterium]
MKFALLAMVVLALAVGAAAGAWAVEQSPEAAAPHHDAVAVTPVLSVRRTPEALLRPRRDALVATVLADIPARIPGDSCLVVTEDGRPVVVHQGDRPLVPASTQKLLVSAALLELVQPADVFTTTVRATAAPADGVVNGDVWIVGGGDPLLATDPYRARTADLPQPSTRFEELADALTAAGVTRIEGSVLGDGTRYDDVRDVPSWPDRYREQVSAGPLSGLGVNDGLVTFTPEPVPVNPGVPAADPPAHTAQVLTDLLAERGVTVVGAPGASPAPADSVELASLASPVAVDVAAQMNLFSDNTTAELLLKEIGVQTSGEGTTLAGVSGMVATLAGSGVRLDGVSPVDGSGLDLGNRVTCNALTDVLDIAGPDSALADTLAVAGESGTLRDRLVGTPAAGQVRAKTGSLRHVNALAGFVETAEGRTYTFAYVANLPEGEFMPPLAVELQDELLVAIASLTAIEASPELEPVAALAR